MKTLYALYLVTMVSFAGVSVYDYASVSNTARQTTVSASNVGARVLQ
jgi:hypothetical protein